MRDRMPFSARFKGLADEAGRWARQRRAMFLLASALVTATGAGAQMAASPPGDRADKTETEAGIPVDDPLVRTKCGTCHTPDDKGNLSRISWVRTTPEGWAQVIHRMVKLNGLQITPDEAKAVVRSLSASHGLAPEEARPVMYLVEHRIQDETNIPNETVRAACAACHAFAQPLSWRRSAHEWKLLQDMHVALYQQADTQYRRRVDEHGIAHAQSTEGPAPGVVALAYMRQVAPLHSAEWESWHARMRPAQLDGKWLISASIPGKGRYVGTMNVAPGKGEQEYATSMTLHALADGSVLTRKGAGVVYDGYAWRGASKAEGAGAATPESLSSPMRETLWFAPDQKTAMGRWFWGFYQEFGVDVKLTRASSEPTILSVAPYAIKAGSQGARLHILGDNLPTGLAPRDIALGRGVSVGRIVSSTPEELVVDVNVAAAAPVGLHDVAVKGAVLESALPIYRNVDYMKVTPENAISRLGGSEKHPKGYQQFEAIGFDNGPDGKPGTADDVPLGPVDATWSIAEFPYVYYDDDKNFVGQIDGNGLFTPNIDGPNPQRRFGRNNYGEVWAVATAKTAKDAKGKPLTGKAFLIVSVPAYKRWDQPEVDE